MEKEKPQTHHRLHEEAFTRAYSKCREKLGLDIVFGRSRHSVACSYQTVQLYHCNPFLAAQLHTSVYIGAMQVWHEEYASERHAHEVEVFKGEDCVLQFLDYLEKKIHKNIALLDA